jgi:signal transduction histidine kinase
MVTYTSSAETVYNVLRQLNTSLDLDEVLGKVLHLTVEATGAMRGSLLFLNEQGAVTRQILARPNQSPEVSRRNVDKVMQDGLAGWVYRHQYGALAADTTKDKRWVRLPHDEELVGSALVVPLLYQERVTGLLALHHHQVQFFDESHLALAARIAGQSAIALENARLFTRIKHERESLEALINGMPIPVLVVDKNDTLTLANQTARQTLPVAGVGEPLAKIPGGSELQQTLDMLRQEPDSHLDVAWPDGRFFNVTINQMAEVGTVIAMDDITHLKELDAMKNQFVETVSHDLKNPLAVIIGFTQLLELEPNLTDNGQRSLHSIKQSTDHMKALISDLLDLARIEAGMGGGRLEAQNLGKTGRGSTDRF